MGRPKPGLDLIELPAVGDGPVSPQHALSLSPTARRPNQCPRPGGDADRPLGPAGQS
jgi:hypothetical protein